MTEWRYWGSLSAGSGQPLTGFMVCVAARSFSGRLSKNPTTRHSVVNMNIYWSILHHRWGWWGPRRIDCRVGGVNRLVGGINRLMGGVNRLVGAVYSYRKVWAQGVQLTISSGLNQRPTSVLAFSRVSLPWMMFLRRQADPDGSSLYFHHQSNVYFEKRS